MGLCALCCNEVPSQDLSTDQARKKQQPMLLELERMFADGAGEDRLLTQAELVEMWTQCAKKNMGRVSDQEVVLIKQTCKDVFDNMDADKSGKVSSEEFIAFSMGSQHSRGSLKGMRRQMTMELRKHPEKLALLVDRFRSWDKNGDGFLTVEELTEHMGELLKIARHGEANARTTQKLKEELMLQADADADGKVDMWEVIAWTLGRRKAPVELLLYNIGKHATSWLGPLLLGRFDVETFHSAVFVFGSEYWYGGRVFRTDPPCTEQFGKPLTSCKGNLKFEPSETRPELHVVKLGYTFVTQAEFLQFLQEKVVERYTGVEKYDLLTHSCNHFSDESLHFLLGRGVPDHVLELQRMALTPTVRALRPFLNRYLGGFSEASGGGDMLEEVQVKGSPGSVAVNEVLGDGAVVILDGSSGLGLHSHVVATIVHEANHVCEVKYFDPQSGTIVTKSGVPASAIKRRVAA